MKRSVFPAVLCCLLGGIGFGQNLFMEDFQSAKLNPMGTGDLDSTRWTLYNDEFKPVTDLDYFDRAWKVLRDDEGSLYAASLSFFSGTNEAADRWMISPVIDLSEAEAPMLTFRAKAMDAQNRDGFEVRLSEGGIDKDDFTVKLQTTRQAKTNWTYYTIDLSAYAGKNIHLAFIQNSKKMYLVGIDDIAVYNRQENAAYLCGIRAEETLILQNGYGELPVRATLDNTGSQALTSYTLCYRLDSGTVNKQEVTDCQIAPDANTTIEIGIPVDQVGAHTVTAWLERINGSDVRSVETILSFYSAHYASLPKKTFFLEVFSSGTCANCPAWNVALHEFFLEENANIADNSGNFTSVKYQVPIPQPGDPCITDETKERAQYYGINAAPSLVVNGIFYKLAAATTVLPAFRDSIAKFKNEVVPTGLSAYMERNGNTFTVQARVTTHLPDPSAYRLMVCLMEDSIHHLSAMSNGERDYYNVVRKFLPGTEGVELEPATVGTTTVKDFEYTFDLTDPRIFSSVENMSAVVFLQNTKTKRIEQALYLENGYRLSNQETEKAAPRLRVYPNPATDRLEVVLEAGKSAKGTIQLIDLKGNIVKTEKILISAGSNRYSLNLQALHSGIYFVRVEHSEGIAIQKIIKR